MKHVLPTALALALTLPTCTPTPKHTMWDCWCNVEAAGHNGTFNVPMWCDDDHDRYDNGAMMHSYCWQQMSIWFNPDEFTCDCDCRAIEVEEEECY